MVGSTTQGGPGFLPMTALVASRAVNYPFQIPKQLTESATKVGEVGNGLVEGLNTTFKTAYEGLQPRGPAKWLLPLFDKVGEATANSTRIAQRNKDVFWDPFSQGMSGIGHALGGPGAYWALRRSGVEQPGADAIAGALDVKLKDFFSKPTGGGGGGGEVVDVPSTPVPVPSEMVSDTSAANDAAASAGAVVNPESA